MPPGTPHDSFISPYDIRVDAFSSVASNPRVPALHLLSHTHSDHIVGLSSKSFASIIVCSHDAKEMLLRHEVYKEREFFETDIRAEKVKTFSHLKVDPVVYGDGPSSPAMGRDLLKPVPLNCPTTFELRDNEVVTLTLIDANHCPGAVMFLIEGPRGNVLHTGDFRAEPCFLEDIRCNPFLEPYLFSPEAQPPVAGCGQGSRKVLDCLYLDTASIMSPLIIPPKAKATDGLVELIKLCPPDVLFFVNTWTWGYEDILTAIASVFHCKVHVDRYKFSVYNAISDSVVKAALTRDGSSTRFHACERFARCKHVPVKPENGRRVIYVNPVKMSVEAWEFYLQETKLQLQRGERITILLVPLCRHSTLPELREFVSLFRPQKLVPNTLIPSLRGLDWAAIHVMFKDCVQPSSSGEDMPEITSDVIDVAEDDIRDPALQNFEGEGAANIAERWVDSPKLTKVLEFLLDYLSGPQRQLIDQVLSRQRLAIPSSCMDGDDDTDDGDAEDERGRTAHLIFGVSSSSDVPTQNLEASHRPPPVQTSSSTIVHSLHHQKDHLLTPVSSPSRPRWRTHAKGKDAEREANLLSSGVLSGNTSDVARSPIRLSLPPQNTDSYTAIGREDFDSQQARQGELLMDVHNYFGHEDSRTMQRRNRKRSASPVKQDPSGLSLTESRSKMSSRNNKRPHLEMFGVSSEHSQPGQTLISDSHAIAPQPPHFVYPASRDDRHHTDKHSASPRLESSEERRRKRATKDERMRIAETLSQARPDLVSCSYSERRARQVSRRMRVEVQGEYQAGLSSHEEMTSRQVSEVIFDKQDAVFDLNWVRSGELVASVYLEIQQGDRPNLPSLTCVNNHTK